MVRLNRLFFVLLLVAPVAVAAQAPSPDQRTFVLVRTLSHRQARDVAPLVSALLSPGGTLRVQDDVTLEVRDTVGSVARIAALLASVDQPIIPVDVEVMVVRATRMSISPGLPSVPPELVDRIPLVPPYNHYELLARAQLSAREGDDVRYELGDDYRLQFHLGRLDAGAVKLEDFRVFGRTNERPMIHANLRLGLDQTYQIGLSKSQSSPTALMLVLTCRHRPALTPSGRR